MCLHHYFFNIYFSRNVFFNKIKIRLENDVYDWRATANDIKCHQTESWYHSFAVITVSNIRPFFRPN